MSDDEREVSPGFGLTDDDSDGFDDLVAEFQETAEVACPYCGEIVSIGLDPHGGTTQVYTEDCEVCCQPWLVRVRFDSAGTADVRLEQSQ